MSLKTYAEWVPTVTLLVSASAWGLFWIPLRHVSDLGFHGAWSTGGYFLISCVLLGPVFVNRWRYLRAGGIALLLTGLFSGGAIALYTLSFLFTTVSKALLIFYLTPVWSTLLGRIFLREVVTPARLVAVALGVAGLWIILGADDGLPLPRNTGDVMALIGGIVWAVAAVRLNQSSAHPLEWVTVFMLSGLLVSVACLALTPDLMAPPSLDVLRGPGIVLLTALAILSLPINFAILWATNRLSPARVGLLLMMEVVVGICAAAWITDEPYGLAEALGTALILTAALIDIARGAGAEPRGVRQHDPP